MSKETARKVRKDINIKLIVIIVVSILVLTLACFCFVACNKNKGNNTASADSVIADNVYVNSIHVGGLTVEEAKKKINESISSEYFDKTVLVRYNDELFELNLKDIVSVNSEETAKAAITVPSGNEKQVVPFVFTISPENAKKEILKYALRVENKSDVFAFNADYTSVNVDASKITEILDIDKTLELILENAQNDVYTEVTGVLIKSGDEGFEEALYLRLSRPAIDATVGMNEDGSTFIVPEIVGITANKEEFMKLYASQGGKFQMMVQPTFPEVTTEDLDIEFYQDVLGSYTSKYNGNLVNRTKNVSLAANFVNGTVIMPGQRFSYNKVVGKRTSERGFRQATVYTGEGTEEGLGGGICQVSSTIYCAQLRANLKTVSRTNHSYTITYVPLGQDATVSYGVLDYVFENDTPYPIKIQTIMGNGKLTVNILGTKVDKLLTYDIVSVTNSTIAKKEIQKEDPTIPAGQTKIKQNGQSGAVVSTYKVYYKDGVEINREYIGKSTYVPMNKIVLVGTGAPVDNGEDKPETDIGENENPDVDKDTETDVETGEGEEPGIETDVDIDTEPGVEVDSDNDVEPIEPDVESEIPDIEPDLPEDSEPLTSDTGL